MAAPHSRPAPPAFLQALLGPMQAFFRLEASGGILLLLAAAAAMALANGPLAPSYFGLLEREVSVGLGEAVARFTVRGLFSDGLMTVFFFAVGMEVKYEIVRGELRTPARAALPVVAALGGMAAPALIFLAFNAGTPGAVGWAIPMATDIAFTLGCLAFRKGRVAGSLVAFVTALAVFDDIGGILVIALFYGHGFTPLWLLAGAGAVAVVLALSALSLRRGWLYGLGAAALWYCLHRAGIHPTLAGVALGLCVSTRGTIPAVQVLERLKAHVGALLGGAPDEREATEQLDRIEEKLREVSSPLDRLEHTLRPWVSFVIMPAFALANSGVRLEGMTAQHLLAPMMLGVTLGLFVGKQLGVFAFARLAIAVGLAPLPDGGTPRQLYGVSVLTGIGFTVALFIAELALAATPELLAEAKLGILAGSLLSGVVGMALLRKGPSPAT